jgi:UDP-4-amino-4,6-dideoxy-N-acetyl-beta-L-altrosamine transaminase
MTIPYGRQNIGQEDIDAVVTILGSEFLTQGPAVALFERTVADYCDVQYGVAVSSATAALHLSCLALDIGPGDLVWTSAVTFVASANCARYCGADVDFVDIDSRTLNMDMEDLERKLEVAEKIGRIPKLVIPVHLSGYSCDMRKLASLAEKYGFLVIEDASHAVGGSYEGRKIGSCEFSDITVFSFHAVKIVTTGEGGMALTDNSEIANKITRLRSHGITRDTSEMSGGSDGPWYYEQLDLGFNYRITDIQAALGISQMNKLDEFISQRQSIAGIYDKLMKEMPITLPVHSDGISSSLHLYIIQPDLDWLGCSHQQAFERLRSNGILVNLHYIPVYRHPYYAQFGYNRSLFPNAEVYYSKAISLPIYPGLQPNQQEQVIKTLLTAQGHQVIF